MQRIVILGCGDIGERVARLWYSRGVPVTAVLRSATRVQALQDADIDALQMDLANDDLSRIPTHGNRIYYFAPPPNEGRTDPIIARWLASLGKDNKPAKIVYISTTGVYGDCQGAWIDEDTPVNPQADRAWRRVDAEQRLQSWARDHQVPLAILRVAGIYGPGRLPLEALKKGQPVLRNSAAPYSNRIHADDLAQVCVAAMVREEGTGIFNVCDGEESTMSDYYQTVARVYELPPPEEIGWEEARRRFSPGLLSYLVESRRIRNQRMLERLKVKLHYPTLLDGVRATRAEEGR
ncbi:MAG: SDR family oxidoreductase [Pseudomonadota bacterium]